MYSKDVKNIAIRLYNNVYSFRRVANVIGSSHSSIHRWLNSDSNIERKIQSKKLNNTKILDSIKLYIQTHPFCNIKDVKDIILHNYNISVSKELVRLTMKNVCNFSRKKAMYFSSPKNEIEKLSTFIEKRKNFVNEKRLFVSIDETSFGRNFNPYVGYALKGQRLNIRRPNAYIKTKSVLTCISQHGNLVYKEKPGSFDTTSFCNFLDTLKFPEKTVFLLDNVSFHHSKKVKEFCQNKSWDLLYIPPYSPVFNPIEGVFSVVKRNYYKFMDINKAFSCVNSNHINSFFNHSMNAVCKFEI